MLVERNYSYGNVTIKRAAETLKCSKIIAKYD